MDTIVWSLDPIRQKKVVITRAKVYDKATDGIIQLTLGWQFHYITSTAKEDDHYIRHQKHYPPHSLSMPLFMITVRYIMLQLYTDLTVKNPQNRIHQFIHKCKQTSGKEQTIVLKLTQPVRQKIHLNIKKWIGHKVTGESSLRSWCTSNYRVCNRPCCTLIPPYIHLQSHFHNKNQQKGQIQGEKKKKFKKRGNTTYTRNDIINSLSVSLRFKAPN